MSSPLLEIYRTILGLIVYKLRLHSVAVRRAREEDMREAVLEAAIAV